MSTFTLDQRLEQDSLHIVDLPLSQVRLSRDARYPWVILVPRHAEITEVYDLAADDQTQLWREASRLGEAMMAHFGGDKLNIATLGNVVKQFHLHVVVRFERDAAWPGPVWGHGNAEGYTEAALGQRVEDIVQLAKKAGLAH